VAWEIRQGDALERLREMPDESVQCCVTSPPYWGLRDYGVDGQLGLEETPEQFVSSMVEVFAEVRRVLRADGTLWLNIGDSYCAAPRGSDNGWDKSRLTNPARVQKVRRQALNNGHCSFDDCKPKDLLLIPAMLAIALRTDGWYLRRDIVWSKPNPMPESVTDRPTSSHEYLFLLSKSPRYFYDAEAIREQATWVQKRPDGWANDGKHEALDHSRRTRDKQRGHGRRHDGFNDRWDSMSKEEQQALGRNKRSVWTIATRPYPDAHFATFPPDLVGPCILAGTPPKVCGECGAPWERLTDVDYVKSPQHGAGSVVGRKEASGQNNFGGAGMPRLNKVVTTTGWQPTCDHEDDSGAPTVLDPFAGAGTTSLVATQLGRDSIGIELNPTYAEMAEDRIRRWEANPAGHLKSRPTEIGDGQGSLLELTEDAI
jgi:DNA modification methylase